MMKDRTRIVLVVSLLLGATLSFSYWSLNQFDAVFDSLAASPATSYSPVNPRLAAVSETSTSTSSTPPTNQNGLDSNFQLIFSPKGDGVYMGCTYEISWSASTTIQSLETALVDAGTRKPIGPKTSGLAKESSIEASSQSLKWKVGVVWPGEYFISILNVNGVAADERSRRFMIHEIPSGSDEKEQKRLCEETGGNLF